MAVVQFLQSGAGRSIRAAAGVALVVVGGALGGWWWLLAAVGLVPLAAAIANACLFAPLVHAPIRGRRPAGV